MNSEQSADDGDRSGEGDVVVSAGKSRQISRENIVIRVESAAGPRPSVVRRLLLPVMTALLFLNLMVMVGRSSSQLSGRVPEQFVSGERDASDRIAIINVSGTISPPFTDRWLRQIRQARDDKRVRGVVLAIDSPGGLVADSHQLYHELQQLVAVKPVYAAMKRMAASGGYYIAMGIGPQGRIYAEPTTWTGSIGVIIPRYNATELAGTLGVKVEPMMTGELKDTLSPFRELREDERAVWEAILQDSFDRFVSVIADNRQDLDHDDVRSLATGQIYTSRQALERKMIDEVGFVDDAVRKLAAQLQLSRYRAVEYRGAPQLLELLLSSQVEGPPSVAEQLLDAAVPRALYYCSWNPWVPIR